VVYYEELIAASMNKRELMNIANFSLAFDFLRGENITEESVVEVYKRQGRKVGKKEIERIMKKVCFRARLDKEQLKKMLKMLDVARQ